MYGTNDVIIYLMLLVNITLLREMNLIIKTKLDLAEQNSLNNSIFLSSIKIKIMKYKSTQALTIAFVLTQTIFSSCGSSKAPEAKENETKPPSSSESITAVLTATAESKNFEYLIQSNGKIKSLKEQVITCESGGKLLVCNAQTGKNFLAGALILQLETTPIQYRIERAKLTQFNSQKEYESQLLGYESLLKDKTKEEGDAIRQKLKISTGLSGAVQDAKEANYELTKAILKAPFTGVLANVKVQPMQQLKPGEELYKIYDPYNLLLEIKILETDIAILKQGIAAEVSPVSNPAQLYKATVFEINPYVDENGMVTVKLKIISPHSPAKKQPFLFPGMNCIVTIKVPLTKTLVVPKAAVVMRSGKAVVFTTEKGIAKWNYVITGRDNGKELEIKEGLAAGAKVIITNNLQLGHDAPVKEEAAAALINKEE